MATSTDAARDRVLAARGELQEHLHLLEASGRAAVDIPARIKRSPAKAAAIAGGAGFLVLKGPQRLFGAARTAIRGPRPDLPERMLPDEIEKTLRKLGKDGDKVRGALERDFASYAKRSEKERQGLASILLLAVVRPLLGRGAKAAGEILFTPDHAGFAERLAQVRDRAEHEVARRRTDDRAEDDAIATASDVQPSAPEAAR
ncbi:MAG: hypothetical protein ABIP77_08935 [Candidatus Limnocylindrales bacterium]